MQGYFIKNIGANRGKPRIWMEGLEVTSAGLQPGDRFDVRIKGGVVCLQANPDGSRVVSRRDDKRHGEVPIIDINSKQLLALFEGMSAVRLVQRKGEIYLLPLATEIRKKERLNRLQHKIKNGIPLEIGSLSHGIGLLAKAVHDGFNKAGLMTQKGFVNEIRPELLEHASHAPEWTETTVPIAAPMQELAFDEAAMRNLPRQDGFELGLPCSGASVSGRARRGTAVPEEHPEVGHLVVAALMILAKANPAFVLFENVVPYASSGSAAILRNQLRDLGYVTHETVLNGEEFNALEHRNRWCMVAVTEGMHFDWEMLQKPERKTMTLSDVLDDIPDDSPLWSEMRGLKDKEVRDIANGKGFRMQVFGPESEKISTITKGYAKVRSTDAKLSHPANPDLLRQLTVDEHAKVKQWPPSVVEGLSKTIAHEALGQSVLHDPFEAAAKLLGEAVLDYAHNGRFSSRELVQLVADHVEDSASLVVSEIRAPMANVTYEGRITINEAGAVIQDVGNGVGILHKASAFDSVKLGEALAVKYPSKSSAPIVVHLDRPAPAVTPALEAAMVAEKAAHQQQNQMSMFPPADEPAAPSRPSFGMRM